MKGKMRRLMRKSTGNDSGHGSGNEAEMNRKWSGNESGNETGNGTGNEAEMDRK